jgi:hypothetical protein
MAARTNTTKARQGFTQTPHSYRTLIRERRVSGLTQHLILFVILDETIGRDGLVTPTPEWADLRIADLALECDADRRTIELALADLVKRGMIERAPVARKWRVRALVENWLTAPPYEQKPVHQVEEQEAVEDEEPVAAPPPSPAPPPMSQFIVRPGRAAKPVLLEREVRRVQYHFEASSEFRVETAIGDGIVHCSIFELPAKSEVERLTKYTSQDNGKANGKSHERLTNYTPIQSALTPSESTNGYSHNPLLALLTKHLAAPLGKAPDATVLRKVAHALHSAPLEYLERLIVARLRKRDGITSYGLIPALADEAFHAWQNDVAAAPVANPTRDRCGCGAPLAGGTECRACEMRNTEEFLELFPDHSQTAEFRRRLAELKAVAQ